MRTGIFLDSLTVDTKLVLVNAIYFKSPWKYPFPARSTNKAAFYVGNYSSIKEIQF